MKSNICMKVGSASYMTGLFLVPIATARNFVQDDYFDVAEVLPGRAVFFIGSGEFRDSDIGAYREMYVGFYTENRETAKRPGRMTHFVEFIRNESKLFMWKNWLSTQSAMDKMERAGAEIFRLGEIQREDVAGNTTLSMESEEGSIQYSVPRESRTMKSNFNLKKTHYGRLHGVPSMCQLSLEVKRMSISPLAGALVLQGEIASEYRNLGIPKKPLVSIWIEEMSFKMHKPSSL